ncbi:MAG: serine hydrolase, partial [Calditrichia bacterium]|nr:serine hydrolase [Calditrichia bacterium]
MLRKASLILNLFLLILIVIIAGCDKDKSITKPEFTSLEEEIDDIAQRYVKVGAIIGIINKQQERLVFSYGTKSINNNEPPDINTVFEIGSITKTFTTTLAADMY